MVIGASCLTGIINCQIRKENPSQTLSDVAVDFYDVRPGPNCFLTLVQRCVTDVQYRYSIGETLPGTVTHREVRCLVRKAGGLVDRSNSLAVCLAKWLDTGNCLSDARFSGARQCAGECAMHESERWQFNDR